MVKKLFALASVTGLTGLVAAITAAGCSSTTVEAGPAADSGTGTDATKAKDTGKVIEEDSGGEAPSCKDTKATFTAPTINPPTAVQKTACDDTQIKAIVDACAADLTGTKSAACKTARDLAANKSCSDCTFGTKADALWKVVNIDEAAKTAQYNQAGCIDHVTGVPQCGAAYITLIRCANTYCPTAPNGTCDDSTGTACFNEIKAGECKQYFLGNKVSSDDEACSNALQAKEKEIDANCFAEANTAAAAAKFMTNMIITSCKSEPAVKTDADQ